MSAFAAALDGDDVTEYVFSNMVERSLRTENALVELQLKHEKCEAAAAAAASQADKVSLC